MATEKLEELSLEQLKKREKTSNFLLVFYPSLIVTSMIFMIFTTPNLVGAFIPLLFLTFPIVNGRKKIKEELKKRETAA
jgi:hypothetical protein